MELQITVYDDNDKAVKVCKAQTVDIKFGQISAIMELIDVENIENNAELLKTVHRAWKQLKKILGKILLIFILKVKLILLMMKYLKS